MLLTVGIELGYAVGPLLPEGGGDDFSVGEIDGAPVRSTQVNDPASSKTYESKIRSPTSAMTSLIVFQSSRRALDEPSAVNMDVKPSASISTYCIPTLGSLTSFPLKYCIFL